MVYGSSPKVRHKEGLEEEEEAERNLWLSIVNLFYCVHVIRLTISTYIMYKCCPNKTVFFIVFTVTLLLQGQFKVETTTSFQPHFNVETTTSFQPHFNVETTTSVQLSNTTILQPCFNVNVWPLFQRWYSVVVPAGKVSPLSTVRLCNVYKHIL